MRSFCLIAVSASLILCASVGSARAQTTDQVSVRALGMGGAFTAVADDATATWWNPAGLASGAYFNSILEYAHPDQGPGEGLRGVAFAFPALGLSYYRLPRPGSSSTSTDTSPGSREDEGSLSVYGATVGQSIGNHLVVGSTVKLLRADGTKTGLDVGALAAFRHVRAGLMVRNITEPDFGSGATAFTLRRQMRAGGAFMAVPRRGLGQVTVSVDADVTATETLAGDERRVAVGAEVWTPRRGFAVRGGTSRSMVGSERSVFSGGASVAMRAGLFVDAQATGGGTDKSRRGWGLSLRVTF
jgi:F plasmid transfer operon protein TraF